ncbi:hypothetical protein E308F_30330 [Moorella sp. E308F]|uniref:hypothetical protein n=1 Tax=Moorella sp. E308F TaxID=2572682 RepID=UPI0010FFAF19|nr:hypothetical protein [Moorella sp. E308F]GEA16787.1 hypothetical protein E308F_30330 [Moorella sp. E308F]
MKVYQYKATAATNFSLFSDPNDIIDEMMLENEYGLEVNETLIDIPKAIEEIKSLEVGGVWRHQLCIVKCIEMAEEDYYKSPQRGGLK